MSQKMRFFVSVVVAVLILTVGSSALVLAQEGEKEEPAPPAESNSLLSRVAEIMGISEAELLKAFQQAQPEMNAEKWAKAFDRARDKAVEKGLVTPEEANEIREWWAQKPESLTPNRLRRLLGFGAPHAKPRPETKPQRGQGLGLRPWHDLTPETYNELLEKALASGRLSEEEADKLTNWLEKRPETAKGLSPLARITKGLPGRQKMAVPKGLGRPELPEAAD